MLLRCCDQVDQRLESAGPWGVAAVDMAVVRRRVLGRVGLVLVGRLVDGRLLVGLLGCGDAGVGLLARQRVAALGLGSRLLALVRGVLGAEGGDEAGDGSESGEEEIALLAHSGAFRAVRVHDLV